MSQAKLLEIAESKYKHACSIIFSWLVWRFFQFLLHDSQHHNAFHGTGYSDRALGFEWDSLIWHVQPPHQPAKPLGAPQVEKSKTMRNSFASSCNKALPRLQELQRNLREGDTVKWLWGFIKWTEKQPLCRFVHPPATEKSVSLVLRSSSAVSTSNLAAFAFSAFSACSSFSLRSEKPQRPRQNRSWRVQNYLAILFVVLGCWFVAWTPVLVFTALCGFWMSIANCCALWRLRMCWRCAANTKSGDPL